MVSIYNEVMQIVKQENTKIGCETFNVLDSEGICGIVKKDGVFWFEEYSSGNNCSQKVYNYLIKCIKRKMRLDYLYDMAK